jgi:D-alanine-D-alanine ligase
MWWKQPAPGTRKVLVLSNQPGFALPFDEVSEREVDEVAAAIADALAARGVPCERLWLTDSVEPLLGVLRRRSFAAVFNICESLGGSPLGEILVAAALELLNVPYTGCPTAALGLCLDKALSKSLLRAMGYPVPKFFVVSPWERIPPTLPFRLPAIVKPLRQDASIGIHDTSVVRSKSILKEQVAMVHQQYHEPAIVEEFIHGREFNVSVIGHRTARPLPVSEIDFSGLPAGLPKIVSYEAKWNKNDPRYGGTVPIVPARIPKAQARRLQKLAANSGRALGCRHYWRVDFRVSKDGEPFIVEVNPNPDLHPEAGLARALKAARLPYDGFILKVIEWAKEA